MEGYRRFVAEKQLKFSRCLLNDVSELEIQMELAPAQRRAQEFVLKATRFVQNFTEMKDLERQKAKVQCLLHYQKCQKGESYQTNSEVSTFQSVIAITLIHASVQAPL